MITKEESETARDIAQSAMDNADQNMDEAFNAIFAMNLSDEMETEAIEWLRELY